MKKLLPILLSLFLLPWFSQITHAATPESISLIPKMTSNTSPSGKVSYSDAFGDTPGWRLMEFLTTASFPIIERGVLPKLQLG